MRPESWLLFALALATGCSREPPPQPLRRALPEITVMGNPPTDDRPPQRQQRREGKRYRDAPVYVDGRFMGMLKFAELPPQLTTIFRELDDGRKVIRFAWSDYLASIGIDLAKVKMVHLYGGRDIICVVSGDEMRRTAGTFRFSFTRGNSGLPRLELPPDGVRYNTYVDKVRALAVYVDKEPPRYENDKLTMPGGQAVASNVFPYADGERHGGTRVYLDGAYRAAFQRRDLKPPLQIEPGKVGSPYSMGRSLVALGIPITSVKRLQMFGPKDNLLLDLPGSKLAELDKMTFTLPQHNRGRILADLQPGEKDPEALEAIILHRATEPPDRRLPTPPAGSKKTQGKSEKTQ